MIDGDDDDIELGPTAIEEDPFREFEVPVLKQALMTRSKTRRVRPSQLPKPDQYY